MIECPSPFVPTQFGNTASSWAAANFHIEALRTLLAAGANPASVANVRQEDRLRASAGSPHH